MARPKLSSRVLENAERRIAALECINPNLDLGNSLTLTAFNTSLEQARTRLKTYNTLLSAVDDAYRAFQEAEESLGDLAEHMLLGVAVKYGKNSAEYGMAGGVRKSERKRPTRKPKTETTKAATPVQVKS
ncbi:hypothetical protein [Leptolyngbya sp. FACHB-261]|uniref:hypothetical protein n=1 Tax=Leptolyngbya sp. FACHB-261 TaxID=2692806 RepID=UPI00168A2CF1|nr:hypothetical protein [Leptolyngbya sp. FACHB-261]MBD2104474.1 hypothetical protein [Leptolyngbya sp. FACHB-261]